MTRRRLYLSLGAALVLCAPASLQAQVGDCNFLPAGNDEVTVFGDQTFIRRPRLACADGVRISADSLRYLDGARYYQIWGRVSFENEEIILRSADAEYYDAEGRLTARGNASLEHKTDRSTVTGESLELLEQTPQRPQQQLTATGGRPHALMHPERRETAPADTLPFEVDADRIFLQGKVMQASGDAEIRRGQLEGSARQIDYNGDAGQLVLTGSASLLTGGYDLAGGLLILQMPDGEVREVLAREGGSLVSERLTFEAPLISFVLSGGEVERLVGGRDLAWVRPDSAVIKQPRAVYQDFVMTGDSLDMTAPGGSLEIVLAMGNARAEMASDLVVPEGTPDMASRDWIVGDTISARFRPVEADSSDAPPAAPPDSAAAAEPDVQLERLFAHLGARAFYRMAADTTEAAPDTATDCLAFHYVTGDSITIYLEEGAVASTEVMGHVEGQHWEPSAGCKASAQPADSTAAPSTSTPPAPSPAAPSSPPPPPTPSGEASIPLALPRPFWARAARESGTVL